MEIDKKNIFYEIQNKKEFLNEQKNNEKRKVHNESINAQRQPENKRKYIYCIRRNEKVFEVEGVEAEIVQVGNKDVRGCIACRRCVELGKCVFDDVVNELAPKFEEADGIVVASPVYFASANATLIATLDRLFFSTSFDKTMKVGASVVCARRGGCSATFDELNKYFTISNMPIAASQYWNCIHGRELGEADRDEEGKQTMRVLARNMTFLMKSIELGKKQFGLPEKEEHAFTHFIR